MTTPDRSAYEAFIGQPVGTVVKTIHGNSLRRFPDGWSPWEGWAWDRMTVYSDAEAQSAFRASGDYSTQASS